MNNKRLTMFIIAVVLLIVCSGTGLVLQHFSLNIPKLNLLSGLIIVVAIAASICVLYRKRLFEETLLILEAAYIGAVFFDLLLALVCMSFYQKPPEST